MNGFSHYHPEKLTIFSKEPSRLPDPIRRLLIVQLGDIGDVVLSIPTFRSFRENYPDVSICVTSGDKSAKLIDLCPWSEKVPTGRLLIAVLLFSLVRYKEWGPKKFEALVSWIRKTRGFPVLLCGNRQEQARAEALRNQAGIGRAYNLAGETSRGKYTALLRRCRLLIGFDSAGVHIAAAVGTPTVTICGSSSPKFWAPLGARHAVIQKSRDCSPCRRKGCNNSERCECLKTLSVREVIQTLSPLMPPKVSRGKIAKGEGYSTLFARESIPPTKDATP